MFLYHIILFKELNKMESKSDSFTQEGWSSGLFK